MYKDRVLNFFSAKKCFSALFSKFGKHSSGHGTRKGQFSLQSQRRAMPKNVQTTTLLHSFHTLARWCSVLQARLQQYVNQELPDTQAGFRKGRGTTDQIANIRWIKEKQGNSRKNIYFCFIDYVKAFDCVVHNKLLKKTLIEMEIPDHLTCLLKNLYSDQEAIARNGHGKQTSSKLGKEYIKTVYCHPAYLPYMQNISCEMLGWMKLKLE